jgi:hypothetical protein
MHLTPITGAGFATSLLAATAAAITAGAIVGGFFVATVALMRGRSRREVESTVLRDGYFGAGFGIFCLTLDRLIG